MHQRVFVKLHGHSMQNIFFFFIEYLVTNGNESDLRVVSNRLDLTGFSLIG